MFRRIFMDVRISVTVFAVCLAVMLVTHGVNAGVAHPAYWALAGFYVIGALFFSYLTFFSSGLRKQ